MMNVISSEIYKILKNRIFYAVIILFLSMNVIAILSGFRSKYILLSEELESGISMYVSSYAADGIYYIILIFTAFLITSEYSNGSIGQMACHGIARWKLVIGSYIAMSSIITIVILVFGFINLLSFTILSNFGEIDMMVFIKMNLGLIALIWSTSAIGTFLSYLFKNGGITILVALLLVTGSTFIVNLLALITKNNIFNMYSLTNMRKIIIDFSSKPQDVLICTLVFLVVGFAGVLGSCILFSKRDID